MPPLITATMATQHPDNVNPPYWRKDSFLDTASEVEECYRNYADLGCQEQMWDWEGKFVDEAVIDRLLQQYYDFFKEKQLGKDVLLTFRLPNIWEERGYRIGRAFMSLLSATDFAADLGLHCPPVFEVILPMTDAAYKLGYIRRTFRQTAELKRQIFRETSPETYLGDIGVIPLIEGVAGLHWPREILEGYLIICRDEFGGPPEYLRPFIARSDPALNAGYVPAVVAARVALSDYYRFQEERGIAVYPIIGVGSLPFRGGLRPGDVASFLGQYPGVRTVTVQSAFRYDFPREQVVEAVAELNETLPEATPDLITEGEVGRLEEVMALFATPYRRTVEALAATINDLARWVPQRRERMLHVGLFGYSRGVGRTSLPRAITFVAALYSLGVPPELIGTGRGLRAALEGGLLPAVERSCLGLDRDLVWAGRYLNKENLRLLAALDSSWEMVTQDVAFIEEYLGEEIGPREADDFLHRNYTSNVFFRWRQGEALDEDLIRAAAIRRSLG